MGIPLRVLVIEDNDDDAALVLRDLRQAAYQPASERVTTASEMQAALAQRAWDLIVCDYSMPHFSGIEALTIAQKHDCDVPFIFVSGSIGEDTAVEAMKQGAHDYVMKNNRKRLIPAIQRELREADGRRQRKRAEEALRQSEASYRELFENAVYGIYRSTIEGRFLDVNPSLVRILGYDRREELMATSLLHIWQRASDRNEAIRQLEAGNRVDAAEYEWKRKDGTPIVVRLSVRPITDPQGSLRAFESIVEDVTERRQLERQVLALQKFEALGRLVGGIAHDFNNVLGAVLGWAELGMLETPTHASARKRFTLIGEQAKRAASLIKQLLAFARQQVLEPHNISLNRLIGQSTDLLTRLVGEEVTLDVKLDEGLHIVNADATQVEQILMNLSVNARDAMPDGGQLIIETRNVHLDKEACLRHRYVRPGRFAALFVSDTGTGIDPAVQDRIFEPFFSTKEVGKGTGLGLATVYGIVKQHNGFVEVQSVHGQGTTFSIYFPAVDAAEDAVAAEDHSTLMGGSETILVADDNDGLRELTREYLEAQGYVVFAAQDGEEAVKLFEQHQADIDLLLFDVAMPKVSGPQAYRRIAGLCSGIPVIFSTGYSAESTLVRDSLGKELSILQKPFSSESLAHKVRQVLDRSSRKKVAAG